MIAGQANVVGILWWEPNNPFFYPLDPNREEKKEREKGVRT